MADWRDSWPQCIDCGVRWPDRVCPDCRAYRERIEREAEWQ